MKEEQVPLGQSPLVHGHVVHAPPVSALVRRFLTELGSAETDFQRRKRQDAELRQRVPTSFQAADNLARDQAHDRGT